MPLYIWILNLFVDTIKDLHSRLLGLPLGMFLKFIERKTYLQAKKINLVSEVLMIMSKLLHQTPTYQIIQMVLT